MDREQFLARIADRPTLDVEVPGMGTVRIRRMSGAERARIELQAKNDEASTLEKIRATLVAACVVDDSGDPMFTEDDVETLNQGDVLVLETIFAAACKHNAFLQADIEELAGN